jgi:hypothetical protein
MMQAAVPATKTTPWVLLAYRLPREPSTPRIALWRRLRRLGAVQLLDGLVALPLDPRTREQFDWIADDVQAAGGDADVWVAEPTSAAQQRRLEARSRSAVAEDYRRVLEAAAAARGTELAARLRAVRRLRKALESLRARDFFAAAERRAAERAVEDLAALVEARR